MVGSFDSNSRTNAFAFELREVSLRMTKTRTRNLAQDNELITRSRARDETINRIQNKTGEPRLADSLASGEIPRLSECLCRATLCTTSVGSCRPSGTRHR